MSRLRRMSVDQYEAAVESSLLDGHAIELIDGLPVEKPRKTPVHVISCEATRNELLPLLPPGWRLTIEAPIRIPEYDEPEPDLAVVRGTLEDYANHHPGPADLAALIEVSDTTLDRDRGEKKAAYARGGVLTYWIINLVNRQLEIDTDPTPTGYRQTRILQPHEQVALVIDGTEVGRIAVSALLPRPLGS